MTDRERFAATMHYRDRDRCPILDFGFWPETIDVWHEQGLPDDVVYANYDATRTDRYFGMDAFPGGPGIHCGLAPGFEFMVIEDQGDHEIVQQWDGVRVLRKKHMGSIPSHIGHLLTDRESWERHYKPRLDPSTPGRAPADWGAAVAIWTDPARTRPVALGGGSLFGSLRDWMGLENIALVPYDDPAWFEEMVETLCECILGCLTQALETGGTFDACSIWEDMCYGGGPLLSPAHFREFLVPRYRRITDLLHRHGVDVVWVDCDGKIDALLPMWLEAGVNCMFPLEVGTWRADPVAMRREYGRDLLMMGGFDKHILQSAPDAICDEVRRLAPLVEEGGYIPFADHRVPPDVPLANYVAYLHEARRVWGRDTNLRPILC